MLEETPGCEKHWLRKLLTKELDLLMPNTVSSSSIIHKMLASHQKFIPKQPCQKISHPKNGTSKLVFIKIYQKSLHLYCIPCTRISCMNSNTKSATTKHWPIRKAYKELNELIIFRKKKKFPD